MADRDGRKMSKSYNNTIPLFETEKQLQKNINKIVTNSLEPGQPKDADNCTVFDIYSAFANEEQIAEVRQMYADGIGWGDMKKYLFTHLNNELGEKREKYNQLIKDTDYLNHVLAQGAEKARRRAMPTMEKVLKKVGISKLR